MNSRIFLEKQLDQLKPVLYEMMTRRQKKSKLLDDFYRSTIPPANDLRSMTYGCVASRYMNYQRIVEQVLGVSWNVSEIQVGLNN